MSDRRETLAILNRALHATVNSVVQYIEIATPYVPPGLEDRLGELQAMRDEQVDSVHRLTALVAELDGVPEVGVFPYWNVDLNYLDLRFLAGFAARHEAGAIAELEGELDAVRDEPRVHGALVGLLEEKRRHRDALRALAGDAEESASKASEEAGPPAASSGD